MRCRRRVWPPRPESRYNDVVQASLWYLPVDFSSLVPSDPARYPDDQELMLVASDGFPTVIEIGELVGVFDGSGREAIGLVMELTVDPLYERVRVVLGFPDMDRAGG